MIFRCPNCRAIVQPTDEICPICERPVPAEARDASNLPPVVATPPTRHRPRVGRIAIRGVAVAGWVVAIAVVVLVLRAWVV